MNEISVIYVNSVGMYTSGLFTIDIENPTYNEIYNELEKHGIEKNDINHITIKTKNDGKEKEKQT